jgi:hypothetical protein
MPATPKPNQPYAQLENAIEELIYEIVDFSPFEGKVVPADFEQKLKWSMGMKFWTVMREIKRLQASGKRVQLLRKSSTGSPARVVGNRSMVSKRRCLVK